MADRNAARRHKEEEEGKGEVWTLQASQNRTELKAARKSLAHVFFSRLESVGYVRAMTACLCALLFCCLLSG